MKVEGPNKSSGTKGVSKTGPKKSGDSSFSGMIDETPAAEARAGVGGVMSIGQLDALLSLQEAGDGTSEEATKRAKKRGIELLDQLDKLKVGLLTGEVPVADLNRLATTLNTHRDKVIDPNLAAVLDEIDLRVQVELAKLGR